MKNRKICIWAGFIFVIFFCAFCYETEGQPEETDYIMSVCFDIEDGQIKTIFESPVLKKDEAQAVLYGEQKVSGFNISHFQNFTDEYMKNVSRRADMQHLKVLLIGEKLLKDDKKFEEFIEFLHEQNEFSENVYVAIDKSSGEILSDETESGGTYLENLLKARNENNQYMSTTVGRLLASSYNENQALYIPAVSKDKKIEGEWAVACKKAVSYMGEDTARWFLAANCIDCGCELYFKDVYEECFDENIDEAFTEEDNFSIELTRVKRQISFRENNDKIYADIVLTLKGRLKSYCGEIIDDAAERLDKEKLLSLCFSEKYRNLASFSQGKDLFNTYYEVSNKNRSIWKKYKTSYNKYVENLDVNVTVKIDCMN